jgi:hypothetical protein
LTTHLAQAESNRARMVDSELGSLVKNATWCDTVWQVKSWLLQQ